MTFDEIVEAVCDELNLTTAVAITRVGKRVNARYRRVTSSIGLNVARRLSTTKAVSIGVQTVTITGMEKVIDVRSSVTGKSLTEVTVDELNGRVPLPATSDTVSRWALFRSNADSVQIVLDVLPQTAFNLIIDGYDQSATLTGAQEPAFPESYHDILIFGVVADELRKKQQYQNARMNEADFEKRLGELRLFIAASKSRDLYQGKTTVDPIPFNMVGAGGGSGPNGALSYTQTGLITFDRDPDVPFAVTAGSARVPNLRVDTNFLEVQVFS